MPLLLPPMVDLLAFKPQAVPPALAGALVSSELPIALLPVRLETRFFAQPDGTQELRIRIFPDQIHIDAHDPALSASEVQWGQHFWTSWWQAGANDDLRRAAWQQLADRFDPARAAWIAQQLRPTNAPGPDPARPGTPVFPAQPTPQGGALQGWGRTPVAGLLPRLWHAVARAKGQVVGHATSLPVTADPAVGPTTTGPAIDEAAQPPRDDELAIDDGMRWMVDYATAAAQGMALTIKLPAGVAEAGIDMLMVFGVQPDPADVAGLLQAHRHTDGLAFVEPGTPTNNTVEEPSGHDSADPGHAGSYADLWVDALASLPPESQAGRLAHALGLDPAAKASVAALGPLRGAARAEDRQAADMATALWPATWGYYLHNLIGVDGSGLTLAAIDWARRHFIEHVRAFGPLPALRIGRQPYGVLPVTLLSDWQPAADSTDAARELRLRDLLLGLRDLLWRPRVDDLPRVGRAGSDPNMEVSAALRTDAVAPGYRLRHLFGPRYLQHLRTYLGANPSETGWSFQHDTMVHPVLQRLGLNAAPRLAGAAFAPHASTRTLDGPRVRPTGEQEAISTLLATPPLPGSTDGDAALATPPPSLLQLLLRHALQREYVAAAARLASREPGGLPLTTLLRDVELMHLNPATQASTWRKLLAGSAAATGGRTLAEHLAALTRFDGDDLRPLRECREAMARLAGLDAATLERQLAGVLDLGAYRLDAWIGSFAHQRLASLRRSTPHGLRVGGYGWVLNLRPQPAGASLPLPVGEQGTVLPLPGDPGFIHAPSVEQAQAAALLRNGHLGKANAQAQGAFAVDLSSRRVRIATQLLDGVRQGQPLGALLGYRFERSLHERGQDVHIANFRRMAPLASANAPPASAASEAITAQRVVDGVLLQQKWRQFSARPPGTATPQEAPFVACAAALRELDDAVDALGDALVAEMAYQTVRGNTVRAATTLAAIAHGEAPPPELEVARTPRSGIGLTHRVALLLPAPTLTPAVAGWPAASKSPRAAAEPRLNAWAARLLPAPAAVRYGIEQLADDGKVLARVECRLTDLGLTPLDLVHLAPARPGEPTDLLDALAIHVARGKFKKAPPDARLRVDARRRPGWAATDFSLREALEVAARLRQCLAGARALEPNDLLPAGAEQGGSIGAADLDKRATAAEKALAAARTKLLGLIATPDTASVTSLRSAIVALLRFGIVGAVPLAPSVDVALDRAALVVQARGLADEAAKRLADAGTRRVATKAAPALIAAAALARLRAVFGADFLALAPFTAANGAELNASLAQSTALQDGDALAVHGWLQRASRVRDGVARLSAALHAAEGIQAAERLQLAVAQLPHAAGERWVGLPAAAGKPMAAGKLSLVVQRAASLDATLPMAGLWIDDWVEVVPNAREDTGIAFQFNAPDACAPQAVLLAVPPDTARGWTPWLLHRLLLETFELATLRAVDAEALDAAYLNPAGGSGAVGEVAHFLPALCFAVNAEGDAVAPDFGPLL